MKFDFKQLMTSTEKPVWVTGLDSDALTAYFLAQCTEQASDNTTFLYLASDDNPALREALTLFAPNLTILTMPSCLDTSPHAAAKRWICLNQLVRPQPTKRIIFCNFDCFTRRWPNSKTIAAVPITLSIGSEINHHQLARQLVQYGYRRDDVVEDLGSFSMRGDIIDIFASGYQNPMRIECFGDDIDVMRFFRVDSQRSLEDATTISILPCHDFIYPNDLEENIDVLKDAMNDDALNVDHQIEVIENIRLQRYFEGIAHFGPLFENTAHLKDLITGPIKVLGDSLLGLESWLETFIQTYTDIPELSLASYVPRFDRVFFPDAAQRLANLNPIQTTGLFAEDLDIIKVHFPGQTIKGNPNDRTQLIAEVKDFLSEGYSVHIIAHYANQEERLRHIFHHHGINEHPKLLFNTGPIRSGFIDHDQALVYLSEEDFFGTRKRKVAAKGRDVNEIIAHFSELQAGDFVVHLEHGRGKYTGMQTLEIGKDPVDFLIIEYRGGDKIYLPVHRLNVLQKYASASEQHPSLDKLGGKTWETVKRKAKKAVLDMAEAIVALQAKREKYQRPPYTAIDDSYREFEASFAFEETEDQANSIDAIMDDLSSPRLMDRLVCGDVGYGKTEVAMRAAFRTVLEGRQVAVLVPTTVLSFQHYKTFCKRLGGHGIHVEMINRFVGKSRQTSILAETSAGRVDVVIGTHRILSKDVVFKDLGMVIVDEEQRFGVGHKERIKSFSHGVDLLTLTATPIPRTLQMAMLGMRDLSLIATPPIDRLSVRLTTCKFSETVIRKAIENELQRGGQVFFVHNRVDTIAEITRLIETIVPTAKVRFGHGKMNEDKLERLFIDFMDNKFDVLVSTTIIESGIDIPNANTMIINRADSFGLSQLYQLKGRVGRSNRRAYAYFLIPGKNLISAVAKERLRVLQTYTDLGSGFSIASHDLDIRGAGNLLGSDQTGHIAEVGFEMYTELLTEAVAELKGESTASPCDPEIEVAAGGSLPNAYISGERLRLQYYKRISALRTLSDVDDMATELNDRFGKSPKAVEQLLDFMRIKIMLISIRALSLRLSKLAYEVKFGQQGEAEIKHLLTVVNANPRLFQLSSDFRLLINKRAVGDDTLGGIKRLLIYFDTRFQTNDEEPT